MRTRLKKRIIMNPKTMTKIRKRGRMCVGTKFNIEVIDGREHFNI